MIPPASDTRPGRRILFQGDSITDAFRKPEEINETFRLGAGYALLAACRLASDFPSVHFQFFNRGVSGQSLPAIAERWIEDAISLKPDVISLLAGVNDTLQSVSLSATGVALRSIIDLTRQAFPETILILFEPFLFPVGNISFQQLEDLEARVQVMRAVADETKVRLVAVRPYLALEMNRRPLTDLTYDGIHLSPTGAQVMANAWREVVEPCLHL